jgi:hypothetical protein
MSNPVDLTDLVALLRRDNGDLPVWSARFECTEPGSAARMIASFTESASRLTARADGGDQLVLVEFPPELVVAVARLALTVGGVYLRRGLGRLPQ